MTSSPSGSSSHLPPPGGMPPSDASRHLPPPGGVSPRRLSLVRTFFKSMLISLVLFLEVGVIGWYVLTQTTLVFPIRSEVVDTVATTLFGGAEAIDTYAHPDDPDNVEGSVICNDVGRDDSLVLLHAFSRMRYTDNGSRLYQAMVENGVCVTVRDLDFHVGLAHPWDSFVSGWGHSYIEIDAEHLRESTLDIVATTLVHEATHIDRAIQGADCSYNEGCTLLENGVRLEEEIAAHGAEAQWWIDVYGYRGKPGPTSEEAWENQLALAYMTGEDFFADYVREMRSDPRETTDRT